MAKRAREKARMERQAAKRERRESAAAAAADRGEGPDEDALMEEFRELSERHAAGRVAEDVYNQERHRIFVELGIETEDD
jgi:seryl-tRNA synthetase